MARVFMQALGMHTLYLTNVEENENGRSTWTVVATSKNTTTPHTHMYIMNLGARGLNTRLGQYYILILEQAVYYL